MSERVAMNDFLMFALGVIFVHGYTYGLEDDSLHSNKQLGEMTMLLSRGEDIPHFFIAEIAALAIGWY